MARRAKGEGTLYQAADKSWVFQYRVDGQRKTKRFKKKVDAKAFQEALTAQMTDEQPVPGQSMWCRWRSTMTDSRCTKAGCQSITHGIWGLAEIF